MQTPMRAVPVMIAAVLALSGCYSTGPENGGGAVPVSDTDGVPCADSVGATAVWIEVEYSGTAVSTPSERCEVDRNTRITWRGPVDSREPFQLRFHGASPAREPLQLRSEAASADVEAPRLPTSTFSDGRQKIQIVADNESGEYGYDILTRDGGVDPAIIIR